MTEQGYAVWRIRITNLPDGTEAIDSHEQPQMSECGIREEIIDRIKHQFQGYTLEIAREYQDSLGRVIRGRVGNWEVI